jgi:hypothetical protein
MEGERRREILIKYMFGLEGERRWGILIKYMFGLEGEGSDFKINLLFYPYNITTIFKNYLICK